MTKQQDGKDKFETVTTELNEAELENATGGAGSFSSGGGGGSGKVALDPFSITRKIDSSSPELF